MSGGAFNPARAFGPAVVSGMGWEHMWIYWIGDLVGGALAGIAQSNFAHKTEQSSSNIKTNQHQHLNAPAKKTVQV